MPNSLRENTGIYTQKGNAVLLKTETVGSLPFAKEGGHYDKIVESEVKEFRRERLFLAAHSAGGKETNTVTISAVTPEQIRIGLHALNALEAE